MRFWTLLLGMAVFWVPFAVAADEAAPSPEVSAETVAEAAEPVAGESIGEAVDEVAAEPTAGEAAAPSEGDESEWGVAPTADTVAPVADTVATEPAVEAPAAMASRGFELGPMAVDENGVKGRIHTVRSGDTLWDISEAYLGTPWVWPSVWNDNGEIENPHRIDPGDHIWITSGEMRIVSEQEAEQMVSNQTDGLDEESEVALEEETELEPVEVQDEETLMSDEVPASMESLAVGVPLQGQTSAQTGLSVRVSIRESLGYVTNDEIEASTSIVGTPALRVNLVEGDMIYLGLGEGQVEVGDEFTLYRDEIPVVDINDHHLLGYHVDVLGWAVIRQVTGESSIAELRMTQREVEVGDRAIPRIQVQTEIPVKTSPDGIEGNIVFMPNYRTEMGDGDYLYVNRGSLHGFELGSEVEVFVPGDDAREPVRRAKVMTPDFVVAKMVLVDVRPDSSVAYVVHSKAELEVGDRVRATVKKLASR